MQTNADKISIETLRLEAKKEWEARKRRSKTDCSFEEMERLLRTKTNQQIAEATGLSVNRIYQLDRGYFASWLPRKRLSDNYRLPKAALPIDGKLQIVIDAAERAGCRVETISKVRNVSNVDKLFRRRLLVNEHLCDVKCIETESRLNTARRTLTVSVKFYRSELVGKRAVLILVALPEKPPEVYVIPTEILFDAYFAQTTRVFYIARFCRAPIYSASGVKRLVDYRSYLNAWHLLA